MHNFGINCWPEKGMFIVHVNDILWKITDMQTKKV